MEEPGQEAGGPAEFLGSGYDGFAEGFETADLREARALLEELSSASEGRTI